jgi:predicted kinase
MKDLSTENKLILIRGLPGAGKTLLATLLSSNHGACSLSIDDYFTNEKGEYCFEFEKNHLAYKQCETRTIEALQQNLPLVVVHNTFVYEWEMEPYLAMAKAYAYQLLVLTVEKYHDKANTHDVTREQIEKMAEKFKVKLF